MPLPLRLSLFVSFSLLLGCLSASVASAAPLLTLLNGHIATAHDVVVGGKTYDVDFLDGLCADVFSGCDASTAFAFATAADAKAASQALFDSVLLDLGTLETLFDFRYELTNGCDSAAVAPFQDCRIITPYRVESTIFDVTTGARHDVLLGALAINTSDSSNLPGDRVRDHAIDVTVFLDGKTFPQSSFFPTENFTWARWRLRSTDGDGDGDTGTVPEPASLTLFALGLSAAGLALRRRKGLH